MGYNIVKIMTDANGKPVHVLLNDGLSQILHITNQKKAMEMVKVVNENSDSGWRYELRPSPCDINNKKKK